MCGKQDRPANYAYLDLLATALTDHEKNLYELVERLCKVTEKLSELVALEYKEVTVERPTHFDDRDLETLLQAARGILSKVGNE